MVSPHPGQRWLSRPTRLSGYQWGGHKGSALTLSNLMPATYYLLATDTNGCEQVIYKKTITKQPLPALDETRAVAKPDTCQLGLGSITGLTGTSTAGSIEYEWYTYPVGTLANAHRLSAGIIR